MTKQVLYVEQRSRKPFDWNAFLAQERISEEAWDAADDLASDWVTCACGGQCAVLPRDRKGAPKDMELFRLGINFFVAIGHKKVLMARAILADIERRSAYLLTLPNYTDPAS